MRYATTALVAASFLSLLCFGAATPLHAQSAWLPPADGTVIALEAYKASYDIEGITFPTSVWFLSGRFMLSRNASVALELPFSYYDQEYQQDALFPTFGEFEAESTLGNPYVGMSLGPFSDGFGADFGFRIPMANETEVNALLNGFYTDFYRAEAFLSQATSVRLMMFRERRNKAGTLISRARSGVSFWVPTKQATDPDIFFDGDINLWYRDEAFAVGGMFAWRFLMSADMGTFTQRSEFQLGVGASLRFGAVEPGIHARIPLGSEGLIGLGTLVNVILGFNVSIHVQKPKDAEKDSPVGPRIGPRDP